MALFRVSGESFERVAETTFTRERFQERQDLQRLLRADISVLGDDLPGKLGCRISSRIAGGWRAPEEEWADLQDRLIGEMVRLEQALRQPVAGLKV